MEIEIDKLRKMLTDAGIPHVNLRERYPIDVPWPRQTWGKAGTWIRNQVLYPDGENARFDAIWQAGSYGCEQGLIETYHTLGVDERGEPRVMDAEEAFEIIRKDWEGTNG